MKTIDEQINEVLRIAGVQPLYEEQLDEGVGDIAKKGAALCLLSLSMFIASCQMDKKIDSSNATKEDVIAVKTIYNDLLQHKDDIRFNSEQINQSEYSNSSGVCKVLSSKGQSQSKIDGGNVNSSKDLLSVDCVLPKYNKHFKIVTTAHSIGQNLDDGSMSSETGSRSNNVYNNDTNSTMNVSLEDAVNMAKMIRQIRQDTNFSDSKYGPETTAKDIQNYTSTNDGSLSSDVELYNNRSN